jgi:type II pantothenate kinase
MTSAEEVAELALQGSLENIDLTIEAMTKKDISPTLTAKTTASNFGNLTDTATKADIALGILNLVFETAGMMAVFSSRQKNVKDIVLTGNITQLSLCRSKFNEFNEMGYGVRFHIPERSRFATVIGTAIGGVESAGGLGGNG